MVSRVEGPTDLAWIRLTYINQFFGGLTSEHKLSSAVTLMASDSKAWHWEKALSVSIFTLPPVIFSACLESWYMVSQLFAPAAIYGL